jgi:hypothetical protein
MGWYSSAKVAFVAAAVCGAFSSCSGDTRLVVPSCVSALQAACPTEGKCQGPPATAGSVLEVPFDALCYESGVRASFTSSVSESCPGLPDAGPYRTVVEVRKANGSLCYSFEMNMGTFCEYTTFAWYDAAGALVAGGDVSWDGSAKVSHIQCAGAGDRTTCRDVSPNPESCEPSALFAGCSPGSCP